MSKASFDYFETENIIAKLLPLFEKRQAQITTEGKIQIEIVLPYETPWIHNIKTKVKICAKYKDIYFNFFQFIHSECLSCWKVVARPRTLAETFNLLSLQEVFRRSNCKIGIETRSYVDALYGACWYCNSKEEGLALVRNLKDIISQGIPGGSGIDIYLKRGCTEYEMKLGDSSKWTMIDNQREVEETLDNIIELKHGEYESMNQPEIVKNFIKRRWVEWACKHGDETYKMFTGDKSLTPGSKFPDIVKY